MIPLIFPPPYIKRLLFAGLKKDELDDFGLWAFGKDYKNLCVNEMPDKWNELHKHELELKHIDLIQESSEKMIEIYRKKRKCKPQKLIGLRYTEEKGVKHFCCEYHSEEYINLKPKKKKISKSDQTCPEWANCRTLKYDGNMKCFLHDENNM